MFGLTGARVEVRQLGDNLRGAWFPATIVKTTECPDDHVMVEYDQQPAGTARLTVVPWGCQAYIHRSNLRPFAVSDPAGLVAATVTPGTALEAALHGGFWPVTAVGPVGPNGNLVIKTLKGELATVNIGNLRAAPPESGPAHVAGQPAAQPSSVGYVGVPHPSPIPSHAGQGVAAVPPSSAAHGGATAHMGSLYRSAPSAGYNPITGAEYSAPAYSSGCAPVLVYRCKFPGCGKEYSQQDSVRKHCRKVRCSGRHSLGPPPEPRSPPPLCPPPFGQGAHPPIACLALLPLI